EQHAVVRIGPGDWAVVPAVAKDRQPGPRDGTGQAMRKVYRRDGVVVGAYHQCRRGHPRQICCRVELADGINPSHGDLYVALRVGGRGDSLGEQLGMRAEMLRWIKQEGAQKAMCLVPKLDEDAAPEPE